MRFVTIVTLLVVALAAQAAPAQTLRVLVTNDDGVKAPGISAVVDALRANPNLQVTVIAPATNQSGTAENVTTGPITVSDSSTASFVAAKAVAGFPADTVLFGILQAMSPRPDLVVSGTNNGQNLGDITKLSGTVGAAITAARLGVPAIAASTGFGGTPDFAGTATYVAQVVDRFRRSASFRSLLKPRTSAQAFVLNINFPTCPTGSRRGVRALPLGRASAVTGYTLTQDNGASKIFTPTVVSTNWLTVDCTSTLATPRDDMEGFVNGFGTLTLLQTDATVASKQRKLKFLEQ